ncbi:hypothetical protein NVP1170O_146 [Vibrio phage 1.170.O._10N.261.52.C3]|nr:hypothetical protein NVP1170O_146 [Vibrio phage 1.170.O._10N.261.52.C3]
MFTGSKIKKSDQPFWKLAGYTEQEWKSRQEFERKCSDDFFYAGYIEVGLNEEEIV